MDDEAVLGRINELAAREHELRQAEAKRPLTDDERAELQQGRDRARPVLGPAPPAAGARRVRPGPRRRRGARRGHRREVPPVAAGRAGSARRWLTESVLPSGSGNHATSAPPGARQMPASSWSMPVVPVERHAARCSAATVAAMSATSQPSTVYGATTASSTACHPQRRAVRVEDELRTRSSSTRRRPSVSA